MRRNQSGMTLIQVMVAATVMSILGFYVSDLILSQTQMVVYLEDQLEKVEIDRNFESILKNHDSCQNTLQGTQLSVSSNTSQPVAGLRDGSGNFIYESNKESGKLALGQMVVVNESVTTPASSGFVNLVLPVSRTRKGQGVSQFRSLEHRVSVVVDNNMRVTSCVDEEDQGWQDVSLSDTNDFEEECLYRAKLDLDAGTINRNWHNSDKSWVNFIAQSDKYLGAALISGSHYYGIESQNKGSYGYRDTSGTYFPANHVQVTKMEKTCH